MGRFKDQSIPETEPLAPESEFPTDWDFSEMQRLESLGLLHGLQDELEEKHYRAGYHGDQITREDLESWIREIRKIITILT